MKKRKSWTTPDLLSKIRLCDALKLAADSLMNNTAHQEFKKTRNKIKRDIIKAKREFIMGKIYNNSGNPKKYWKELNSLFSPKDTGVTELKLLNENGREIEYEATADYMNDYFANVGHNLASKITADNSNYLYNLQNIVATNRNRLHILEAY